MGHIAAKFGEAVRSAALLRIAVPTWRHPETKPGDAEAEAADRDEFKQLLDATLSGESLKHSALLTGRDEPAGMRKIRRVLLDSTKYAP